jgi:hypothetical protein
LFLFVTFFLFPDLFKLMFIFLKCDFKKWVMDTASDVCLYTSHEKLT